MLQDIFSIVNMEGFIAATILAATGKALVDFLKTPLEKKGYNIWFAGYLALLFGLSMTVVGGINMFNVGLFNDQLGVILTGLYAGGVSVGINEGLNKIQGKAKKEE